MSKMKKICISNIKMRTKMSLILLQYLHSEQLNKSLADQFYFTSSLYCLDSLSSHDQLKKTI